MPSILLTMLSKHPRKNRMFANNLTQGQSDYDLATFSQLLQSNLPEHKTAMKELKTTNQLIINGHGDLSVAHEGPVIASDTRLYTAFEFYQQIAPILRKLPHVKKIDLLACNLGIEYDQKPSFVKELAGHLAKKFPHITVRTFMPTSTDTRQLIFVTETDDIIRHYEGKSKPAGTLPSEYFEILELTESQAKERESIIHKGLEDNKRFAPIAEQSVRLGFDTIHSAYAGNKTRHDSAREKLQEIYESLHTAQEYLDDFEKEIIKPHLAVPIPLPADIIQPATAEKLYKDLAAVQIAINCRERRWDQLNGFVKCSAPLQDMEQYLHAVNVSESISQPKSSLIKNASVVLFTSGLMYSASHHNDLGYLAKALTVMLSIYILLKQSHVVDGLFGRRARAMSVVASNDANLNENENKHFIPKQ